MKNLPMLLLLCVVVCSAYPLKGAAKDDSMDLAQVIKKDNPHTPSQGQVGQPSLLLIYKTYTSGLNYCAGMFKVQSYKVWGVKRVSVSYYLGSSFLIQRNKSEMYQVFPKTINTITAEALGPEIAGITRGGCVTFSMLWNFQVFRYNARLARFLYYQCHV